MIVWGRMMLLAMATAWWGMAAAAVEAVDDWPEYRGPLGNGYAPDADPPLTWSENEHVVFATPIHGRGWSTPVVLGDQIWLTTATLDGTQMSAICVDRHQGRIVYDHVLFAVPEPRPLGNDVNSYATPSPVIEPGRVYVHFGSYGTACLDTETKQVVWTRDDLPCNHYRGPASSLVLFENLILITMDGSDHHYVAALDKRTGETVWKTPRSTDYGDIQPDGKPLRDGDMRKAFNTPIVIVVDGQPLLVSPAAKAMYGYDPRTGEELWQVRHDAHSTAARTLFDGEHVFCNTGWSSARLLAIDPRGRGDTTGTAVVWRQHRQMPRRSSPVLVDGYIYSCSDEGIASCLEAKTGEISWTRRLRGDFSASLIYAGGRIYSFNEDGDGYVFAAEPGKYRELAHNRLDDGLMASPIAVGKSLILRTTSRVMEIGE